MAGEGGYYPTVNVLMQASYCPNTAPDEGFGLIKGKGHSSREQPTPLHCYLLRLRLAQHGVEKEVSELVTSTTLKHTIRAHLRKIPELASPASQMRGFFGELGHEAINERNHDVRGTASSY
jgi:hypothetical protein